MDFYGRPQIFPHSRRTDTEKKCDEIGKENHDYYRFELNSPFGPDGLIGLYNIFSSGMLWTNERGPATLTNFLLPIAEYLQVHAVRTKLLGNPDAEGIEGEIAKQRREGSIAWIQGLAGSGGLASFVLKALKGENGDNGISLLRKALLSSLSFFGSAMFFFSYFEKELLATTSKGKIIGNECKGIKLNANGDLRASIDELAMAAYPWITGLKSVKKAVDLLIPLLAIRDSVRHFVNEGVSGVVTNKPNLTLPPQIKNLLRRVFFISNGDVNLTNLSLPNIFRNKGFFNFRDRFMIPVLELMGCKKIPKIKMDGENGDKHLVVQLDREVSELEEPLEVQVVSYDHHPPRKQIQEAITSV